MGSVTLMERTNLTRHLVGLSRVQVQGERV